MQTLPVFKNDIPYSADIRIEGTTFTFTFNYNSDGDFFTVDLSKNGEVLAIGEKAVYGSPLFAPYLDDRFPMLPIIPLDASGQSDRVGWQELGSEVFLYLVGPEGSEND